MDEKRCVSSARLHPGRPPAMLLAKCLLVFLSALFIAMPLARAADPLGATLHSDGTTTFRVWAPFVDNVAVKINGGAAVPLTQGAGSYRSRGYHLDRHGARHQGRRSISVCHSSSAASRANSTIRGLNNSPDLTCPKALACPAMTISPNPSSWTRTSTCRPLPSPLSIPW